VRDPIIGRLPFLHAWMVCSGRPQLKRAPSLPGKRSAQSLRMSPTSPSSAAYQLSAPAASPAWATDDRTIRPTLSHRARRSPLYALDSVNEHGAVHPPSPTYTITPATQTPMRSLAPAAPIVRPGGGLRSFMSMQDLRQVVRPAPSIPSPATTLEEPVLPVSPASSATTESTMRAHQHAMRRRSASSASSSVLSLARSSVSTSTSSAESEGNSSAGSLSPSIPLTPPTPTTAGRFRVDEATGVVIVDDHIPHCAPLLSFDPR